MLRMFYYNRDDFTDKLIEKEISMYSEREFERLVNWQYDEEHDSIMPFRDEFSKKFLKDTWDMEFVSDDDWYSIQSPEEGRFCLSGLSKEMKYALTLLHYSRNKRVLSYKHCSKRTWKVLSDMPFDILVAVDMSKLDNWTDVCLAVDYIIENFPFNNDYLQVQVSENLIRDKQEISDANGVRLYIEDGKYYACSFEIDRHFTHYDWKKHLESIIKCAGHYVKEERPIVNKTLVCNVVEYAELLGIEENYFLNSNKYAYELYDAKRMLKCGYLTQ